MGVFSPLAPSELEPEDIANKRYWGASTPPGEDFLVHSNWASPTEEISYV